MTEVEAWRALGQLQAWGWQQPPSIEEGTFETTLRLALIHPQDDALIALDLLDTWNWRPPVVVAHEDFERILRRGATCLGAAVTDDPETTKLAVRANRERSEARLAAFLPDFRRRLDAAEEERAANVLEAALRWSENPFEAEILKSHAAARAVLHAKGLDDKGLGIDDLILRAASPRWQKVAMIAGLVVSARRGLSDTEVAQRIEGLVARGALEAQGDLARMRFSEVRLPPPA